MVSGSLSSPSRGAFHLSLTVLVHYRSRQFFSLGGWSPQLPTGFHVPRGTQDPYTISLVVSYRIITCSDAAFQQLRMTIDLASVGPTTPTWRCRQIGLGYLPFRSPLLWESRLISFCRATEMFQFAHCPPLPYVFRSGIQTSLWMGCPIRNLKAHRLDAAPLERFVGLHVLHRSDAPRHPPRTLPRLWCICMLHARRFSRVLVASATLLFALGKIEVNLSSLAYSVVHVQVGGAKMPHQLECGKPPELARCQAADHCLGHSSNFPLPGRSTWDWMTRLRSHHLSLERR